MERASIHLTAAVVLLALTAVPAGSGAAEPPPLPNMAPDVHLGVASCASATCHGATNPVPGGVVLQNEYVTWQTRDPHARAYATLLGEESQRIAHNLGLPDAHTADICLDCHADNVSADRRGPRFQLEDGVGCEACHGGAQRWIEVHAINDNKISHRRNIELGLYPTADPVTRAELCLSCHLGDSTRFVSHRVMGAGHPRLSFELDTFTNIQPAHFAVDEDYRERKPLSTGVQTWAVGQALALVRTLDGVLDPQLGRAGLFPEPVFFDCHACHKPMSAGTWRERRSLGLGPGVIRFNDANLIMVRLIARGVDPSLARRLDEQGRALHRASVQGANEWVAAARALRTTAQEAVTRFAATDFTRAQVTALLEALVAEAGRGEFIDYVAAEQTTMAAGTLLDAMRAAGWISPADYAAAAERMDELYAAVRNDERYRPSAHLAALRKVQAVAR